MHTGYLQTNPLVNNKDSDEMQSLFFVKTKIIFFCRSLVLFMSCVCHALASVHCCLVVTYWERADLLALVCDVKL